MTFAGALLSILLHFWPVTLVPTLLLLLVRPLARLVFFLLGLLFFFAVNAFGGISGPDNPLLVLPFIGLALSLAAMLAELVVRIGRYLRRGGGGGIDSGSSRE